MVFFSCGVCGEQIKKPKVDKHLQRCRTNELTCIDCNVTFTRMSYDNHKSCVTENQRYGGKDYVEKGNKGDDKQRVWLDKIHSAMKKASLSASGKQVWKMLENGGFENIPRKEKKFVNFVKNSLNMRDTSGIYEVWAIFDAAFEKQVTTTPAKKTKSTAVAVKATGDKPWWEQFTPTKKKAGKESSSSDADSESEEEKTPKKTPQKKLATTKRKKESSSSSSESDDEPAPPKKEKKRIAKKVSKKSSSSSSDSSDEEPAKAPEMKKAKIEPKKVAKKESSSDSSTEEENAPKQTSSPVKKITKKVVRKAESSPDTSSSEEDAPIKKKKTLPTKKMVTEVSKPKSSKKAAKESSTDSSSGSDDEKPAPKKASVKETDVKRTPVKKAVSKAASSSSSSSSEDEPAPKKTIAPAPKKTQNSKKASSSSSSSSSEDDKPAPKKTETIAKKKVLTKKADSSSSSSSDSSSDEGASVKKTPVSKKAVPAKKAKESSSSSSSSSSEDDKPAPKKTETIAKKKVLTKNAAASSSSSSDSSSDEEAPAKKTTVSKKAVPAKKTKESSSSSSSSSSEDEKPVAKKTAAKKSKTEDTTSDSDEDSATSGIGSEEDETTVKKVPLKKVLQKEEEKLPAPKIRSEPVTPNKNVHSNKDDFNKERDSRTIFVKNLPFDTTVDDLWYVFGKDEEMTIDCRFIMNRETGTHKGLAFVEYATREKCVEIMGQKWKMNGRPAMVMQAGTKKPAASTPGPNSGLSQDERDMRTLFVKGLPFSSTPEDIVELFGCLQARLLKDHSGQSKGMAFAEFETQKDAEEVYDYLEGYELGGRWLQLDKLRPKSQMNGGSSGGFSGQKRTQPVSAAQRNRGGAAGFEGKKMKFDDEEY